MERGRQKPLRIASQFSAKLMESYCPGCGLLIAASPSLKLLSVMETLHSCPVHFHYDQPSVVRNRKPQP
jgi:hypothetical protein